MAEDREAPREKDGRSERWREHRSRRREELLDATLRAVQRLGKDVTMADIAAEAGVAKPRLYRFFTDKADLFNAVASRTLETIWERLLPTLGHNAEPREAVRHALDAYVGLVDEYPNVVRFLLDSGFTEQTWQDSPIVGNARAIAQVLARFIGPSLADESGAVPMAYSTLGAVAATTEWWLEERSITRKQLVDHLTTFVWGALEAASRPASSTGGTASNR